MCIQQIAARRMIFKLRADIINLKYIIKDV